jgi:HK97 gp10 family phage protein
MARNRVGLDSSEFAQLIDKVSAMGGNVEKAAREALEAARDIVTPAAKQAIRPHHRTGRTESSLRNNPVKRTGDGKLYVDVGFDLKNGGLPSLFLMYGTPRVKKDTKLYNALRGSAIRRRVQEAQRRAFNEAVR